MAKVALFSARACPFAHRTRLVLSEKNVDFELTEIDLQNKPAWFNSVSGYGKVPAIEHEGRRIWESAIINEYLDEVFPAPGLLPEDPGLRATARIWIDYANTRFVDAFRGLLRGATDAGRSSAQRDLGQIFAHIEREGLAKLSGDGPFWLGPRPSLVDFTFYPWFERWGAIEHYRGYSVPAEHVRIHRWREAVRALPAVRAHENPTQYYVDQFSRYVAPSKQALAV